MNRSDADIVRAAEEVARARWQERAARVHSQAALLLRLARHMAALGEAALVVATAARAMGAGERLEQVPLILMAHAEAVILAPVADALGMTPEAVRRYLDLCIRLGERYGRRWEERLEDAAATAAALISGAAAQEG